MLTLRHEGRSCGNTGRFGGKIGVYCRQTLAPLPFDPTLTISISLHTVTGIILYIHVTFFHTFDIYIFILYIYQTITFTRTAECISLTHTHTYPTPCIYKFAEGYTRTHLPVISRLCAGCGTRMHSEDCSKLQLTQHCNILQHTQQTLQEIQEA